MAIKYKNFSAVTKRWAVPIAIVLLPGGFVLLALGWVYKIWQTGKPVADLERTEVADPATASVVARIMGAAAIKARRASTPLPVDPAPRRIRGHPADEPQEHATL